MKKRKIFVALGTRPEAIKLAPLVLAIRESGWAEAIVCNTSQHREMSAQVLNLFGIEPDVDLDIMRAGQSLTDVTTAILSRIAPYLQQHKPDWVVVQGDTTTTFASALAAFYQRIPVVHVEAGLRTGNIYAPWPEEVNRRLVSEIATMHFPPTEMSRANLLREGVSQEAIEITGNTGIDALKLLVARMEASPELKRSAAELLQVAGVPAISERPIVLITGHRRESFGEGFESICAAIGTLARRFKSHAFVYPVHPNPKVRDTVFTRLGQDIDNVYLVPPLAYLPFVALMSESELILTDSGGVQEEAPSLGKRVIVLRNVTERAEGLATGLVRLVGTNTDAIVSAAESALTNVWVAAKAGLGVYGDGGASRRIIEKLRACSTLPVDEGKVLDGKPRG